VRYRPWSFTKRPDPHRYEENPDAPGTCQRCPLIRRNEVHDEDRLAELEALAADRAREGAAEDRRRLGETD